MNKIMYFLKNLFSYKPSLARNQNSTPTTSASPLLFIHIPKTAGTSFRRGAENYFGYTCIVNDYGQNAIETSDIVRDYLYHTNPDFWGFAQACRSHGIAMVGGHIPLSRYVSLFGIGRTITFVREPLQRIASEYTHRVNLQDYQGSFQDFCLQSSQKNSLINRFTGTNAEAIGLLGITEHYAESLQILNQQFDLDIPVLKENIGHSSINTLNSLSAEEYAQLRRYNRQDIVFYQHCLALFAIRWQLVQQGQPYAHAWLDKPNVSHISGAAWWASGCDNAIEIEILINGQIKATTLANSLRTNLCHIQPPRGGYVGFHLARKCTAGDEIQCRIARTGQPFPPDPKRITVAARQS